MTLSFFGTCQYRTESETDMSKITDIVSQLVKNPVEDEGCSLWDVEYVKEANSWYLRVYIDKEGGVSIEDCERISRRLDSVLDEADPVPDSYIFEVASAGADRELKRPSDFKQFLGREVEVKTYWAIEGQKLFVGVLKEYNGGNVTITIGNRDIFFTGQDIALVRLHISF